MSLCASIQSRPTVLFPRRHRVVSAQNQGNLAGFQRFDDQFRAFGASRGDFFQVFSGRIAFLLEFCHSHGDVAAIFHDVAESFEARFEAGHADRGRPHIDAAAGLAKIERDA